MYVFSYYNCNDIRLSVMCVLDMIYEICVTCLGNWTCQFITGQGSLLSI